MLWASVHGRTSLSGAVVCDGSINNTDLVEEVDGFKDEKRNLNGNLKRRETPFVSENSCDKLKSYYLIYFSLHNFESHNSVGPHRQLRSRAGNEESLSANRAKEKSDLNL